METGSGGNSLGVAMPGSNGNPGLTQGAGTLTSPANSEAMAQQCLIMYKDVYDSKKASILVETDGLETRLRAMTESSPPALVEQTSRKLERLEDKLSALWQARLDYMRYINSPQIDANEMVAGRQTQHNLKERILAIKEGLMNAETLVLGQVTPAAQSSTCRGEEGLQLPTRH